MEEDYYTTNTRGKPSKTHAGPGQSPGHAPSKSELMTSAKLMAEAAKSAMSHDTQKIDKAKVAGAAGNLLGAAKHYGKLEEKSYGKYVGKAETYLHKYNSSSSPQSQSHSSSYTSSTTTHSSGYGGPHDGGEGKYDHGQGHSGGTGGGSGGSGGGYGEYVKLAQGLLNKKQDHGGEGGVHSSGGGSGHSSGGGAGDYIKLAQGLLNKKQDHGGEGGGTGHSSGGNGGAGDYIKLAQGFMKKH